MGLLDYGNALYYGLPNKEVKKLQRLQNHSAKTILGRNICDSSTLIRHQLHWLPVEERIKYQELDKETRSSGNRLLKIPKSTCKTFLDRSLAVLGPKLWKKIATFHQECYHTQRI